MRAWQNGEERRRLRNEVMEHKKAVWIAIECKGNA